MPRDTQGVTTQRLNRRTVLKSTAAGVAGIGALSGTAMAGGCSTYDCSDDSAANWEKSVQFIGREPISKGGTCHYRYETAAYEGGQVARVDTYCESEDCAYHRTDGKGNELAGAAGQVRDGSKDVYKFNGPFRGFRTTREIDVEVRGDFETSNTWDVQVRGDGDYEVYFAGSTEPTKYSNCESTDSTGVSNIGGYIKGSVCGNDCDQYDTYRVTGDIKRIIVRNNGNSALRVEAESSP